MAKRRRLWNQEQYHRYLKEGRGQGIKSAYKPWITIHDFPSEGMVSRVRGNTTGRIHHLLSNMELSYFYLLDWSEKVLDIREQYPLLEVDDAIEIADRAGIRYPYDNVSGFPYILTSDFFITTSDGEMVRSIKPYKHLGEPRVREKLEIERRYWKQKGIDWKLVTEREIDYQKSRNIEWFFQAGDLQETFEKPESFEECLSYFEHAYLNTREPVLELAWNTERQFQIGAGCGLRVFQYLVISRRIRICMNGTVNLDEYRPGIMEKETGQHGL